MKGFNPDYEYIHIKNLLDGDPFCELVVRPVKKNDKKKETGKADPQDTVLWIYGHYTRDDLQQMDPVCLRALFRERIHHTIEVDLYPILLGEKAVGWPATASIKSARMPLTEMLISRKKGESQIPIS